MSASLRSFRAAVLGVVVLLTFAPQAASAHVKGYGTLIEYAGNSNIPPHIKQLIHEFLHFLGSGL